MNLSMRAVCWLAPIVLAMCSSCTCRTSDESAAELAAAPDDTSLPDWIPLAGLPVPGHDARPELTASPVRRLTRAELIQVAQTYYPVIDPATYTDYEKFLADYYNTAEAQRLDAIHKAGIEQMDRWRALCRAVRQALPSGYVLQDMTYPWHYPTYRLVIYAPRTPGSNLDRDLVVHLSFLVPYYFIYERHSHQLERFLHDRGPERDRITPVHEPSLAAVEQEIARRYGYWRMSREIAETPVSGRYIPESPVDKLPTLLDALFMPNRL